MKRKLLSLLVALAMLLPLLGAAQAAPAEPQELNFVLGEPRSFDPAISLSNNTLMNAVFEGLVGVDDKGGIIPAAAQSWDISADGLVYTFHLRDGLKWSDGQPVTAEQFAYTMRRACIASNASEGNYLILPYVKNAQKVFDGALAPEELGVKAIDEKTLEMTLEFPASYILQILLHPLFFPSRPDIVETAPDSWSMKPETLIGNGPFVMTRLSLGELATFEKNPNYWDAANVRLDKLTVYFFADGNTSYAAYTKGDVDGVDGVPGGDLFQMYMDNDPELIIRPGLSVSYLPINHANAPLDDLNVRKAIAYAVDRETFLGSQIAMVSSQPAFGMVPPGISLAGKELRAEAGDYGLTFNANIEKAKECLAAAGYPEGAGLRPLTLLSTNTTGALNNAQVYQEMFAKVGIQVEIKPVEGKVYWQEMLNGAYDITTAGWGGDYLHPMTFLEFKMSTNSQNVERWKNADFDAAVLKAQNAQDEETQLASLLEAEKILMEDVGTVPTIFPNITMLIKPYVKNLQITNLRVILFKTCYIEGRAEAAQ